MNYDHTMNAYSNNHKFKLTLTILNELIITVPLSKLQIMKEF